MSIKTTRYRTFALLVSLGLFSGCGAQNDVQESDSETSAYIANQRLWPSTTIPVCWTNGGSVTRKQQNWVREAMEREYESKTPFRFVGWDDSCANTRGPAIRVQISERRGSSQVGRTTASPSMHFTLTHFKFMNWCRNSEKTLRTCIEGTSIHEFGHAVGMWHEQDRHDSKCGSSRARVRGETVGVYDANSIMNYCNRRVYTDPKLTSGDVAGLRRLAHLIKGQSRQ